MATLAAGVGKIFGYGSFLVNYLVEPLVAKNGDLMNKNGGIMGIYSGYSTS
jgi:hypothetical protein